jgi:hypothetical protein
MKRRESPTLRTVRTRQEWPESLPLYPDRVEHLLERAFVALEIAIQGSENNEQQAPHELYSFSSPSRILAGPSFLRPKQAV